MKRNLLISFLLLAVMVTVMRWQGSVLITPLSPRGIIDLEFAKTPERFRQLQLFWNPDDVFQNVYLDFLFIAAYAWFLVTACGFIKRNTNRVRISNVFAGLALSAAAFDVLENFLMLLVMNGRFSPGILQIVYYCAALKFLLAGVVGLYVIFLLPLAFKTKRHPV
jgi:hypothetical protein